MSDQGNDDVIDLRSNPTDEPSPEIALSVRDLTKRFDVRTGPLQRVTESTLALDRVSFDIRRGTTLAVVGESGGGKTTLARCVVGIEKPTEGGVYLRSLRGLRGDQPAGGNVPEIPVHRLDRAAAKQFHRRCQLVSQHSATSLNPRRTVAEAMDRVLKVYGASSDTGGADHNGRVVAAIEQVGLDRQDLHRLPSYFSIGQLQRIAIARSLALNPEVLVLDEPTSAVDMSTQARILNLLVDIQRDRGLSYLLITHELSVALHLADDIAVLQTGRVVESGPAESVLRSPTHPYTRRLVESDPELELGR